MIEDMILNSDEMHEQRLSNTDTLDFLCFTLGKEEFGVDLNLISQIIIVPPITPVPRTRSYFMGVISVRGEIVTVVDFRQLIGLEPATIKKSTRILLFNTGDEQFGLMVDSVTFVRKVSFEMFEENPALEETPVTDKIIGIIRTDDKCQITVIDLDDIMNEAVR
ncbi:MAG: chemotaxis protein CheW [Deltaproteobacteria bacterium]|nr:chemotaxis protein CheW [Deltaproteobacteria bacterium]